MKNNVKINGIKKKRDSITNRIALKDILNLAKENKIEVVKEIVTKKELNGDELLLLVENAARNENIQLVEWITSTRKEVLYCYRCDILDIAVSTCNIELIKTIISKYDEDYTPSLKYSWTLDRVLANNRADILNILKERKIDTQIDYII